MIASAGTCARRSVNSPVMSAPGVVDGVTPARGRVFRYEGFATDPERGLLTCRYSLDGRDFAERVSLTPGPRWDTPAARAAARLVFLLAGVSYYKTAAPPVIDLGEHRAHRRRARLPARLLPSGPRRVRLQERPRPLRPPHRGADRPRPAPAAAGARAAQPLPVSLGRALVPFGGGIDSIVTVEGVRKVAADVALFVVSRPGDRFAAIERPAEVSGLPVVRAGREIDPQLLRSAELGFRNGHVPVTGVISAIAVLAAVLDEPGRGGDVQRVVRVGPDAGVPGRAGQPPVLQERRVRVGLPRRARGRPGRAARATSPPSATGPSSGWATSSPR